MENSRRRVHLTFARYVRNSLSASDRSIESDRYLRVEFSGTRDCQADRRKERSLLRIFVLTEVT